MDNYYNLNLYGNTQEELTSTQFSAQDFLSQNSYDLNRYTNTNPISYLTNNLEIIKEEDIISQIEQTIYENERVSLKKADYIDQNYTNINNSNNNNHHLAKNINSNRHTTINNNNEIIIPLTNENAENSNHINENIATNKNNINININNMHNHKISIHNNKIHKNGVNVKINQSCIKNDINKPDDILDEKLIILSQEIDTIEMQQKEESMRKLGFNENVINNAITKDSNNFSKKNMNNINHEFQNLQNICSSNVNKMASDANKVFSNENNNFTKNQFNKLKNDLIPLDILREKSDIYTTKKPNNFHNEFFIDEITNSNQKSEGLADELDKELYSKIKNFTDNILYELDICLNTINKSIDNYKKKILNDVHFLYKILKEETHYIISEEEKNRMIDKKIKLLFDEMMFFLTHLTKK